MNFISLGRGDGDQRSRRREVDTSVIFRCNRFNTRVDDPRASRTSFATSHLAVVYRGVPYDFLVMIDLHFFQPKKSRARIRPICPEQLCSHHATTATASATRRNLARATRREGRGVAQRTRARAVALDSDD